MTSVPNFGQPSGSQTDPLVSNFQFPKRSFGPTLLSDPRMHPLGVPQNGSACSSVLKQAAVAFVLTTVVVGTLALLANLGFLQVGWKGVGLLTQTSAFYIATTSYGMTLLAILGFSIHKCAFRKDSSKPLRYEPILDDSDEV